MARNTVYTVWTAIERATFFTRYQNLRNSGMGKAESRFNAQLNLPENIRYSDSTMRRLSGLPQEMRDRLDEIDAGHSNRMVVPNAPEAEIPTQVEETSKVEVYLKLLVKTIQEEVRQEMNEKLNKILDYITSPEASKAGVASKLYEATEDRINKPKVVIIGLVASQPHFVELALRDRFKMIFVEANHVATARDSIQSADLVVAMTNFISHDSEDIVKKYSAGRWIRHTGGISTLIKALQKVVI